MIALNKEYWEQRWRNSETGWNIGYASPAIVNYALTSIPKTAAILIPGAGNAYEAEALFTAGFENVSVLDFSATAKTNFLKRFPDFPSEHYFQEDFFLHDGRYDCILEQTFFCALAPTMRTDYVKKMHELLLPKGILAGLFFQFPLNEVGPPFGGSKSEYESLFETTFAIQALHTCKESIPPREGKELWGTFVKK